MNDLISRQALCEYALNQKDKSVTPNDIMRFPPAQPEPHWIPCSERMPEEERYVLVTASNGAVTDAKYWQKERIWVKGLSIVSVTAWMPLPKPYGGENE